MKYSTLLLTGFSLFGFITGLPQTAAAQFSQVEPYVAEANPVKPVENYKNSMIRAMALHNIQYQINYMLKSLIPSLNEEEEKRDLSEAQISALKSCSITKLESVYGVDKASKAYEAIQKEFNDKVKTITVYINETGDTTADTDNAEAYPYWRVGREVLTDVYENPEKYGSKKKDFPLWTDQKYLYTQKVNNILSDIHNNFILPESNGKTQIPQNKAFNNKLTEYLNAFSQQNGILNTLDYTQNSKKYTELLNYLKEHPKYEALKQNIMPALPLLPKPLPPFYEIIQLTEDPAQSGTIFPEWPAPWAEYIRRGLDNRAVGGEMDTCFLPKSVTLRPDVRNWDKTKINNRLSLTKEKEEEAANFTATVASAQESLFKTIESINKALTENGFTQQLDLKEIYLNNKFDRISQLDLGKTNTAEIQKIVKEAKMEAIQKGLDLFAKSSQTVNANNPSVELSLNMLGDMDPNSEEYKDMMDKMNAAQSASDEKFLNDMEQDSDGIGLQSNLSTNDVAQNIESAESQYALQKETFEEAKKERVTLWNTPIDMETCINGGVNSAKP